MVTNTKTYELDITGDHVPLERLRPLYAEGPVRLRLTDTAIGSIQRGYRVISDAIGRGDVVYGVNTGFGKLADRRISPDDLIELQRRVVTSHMVGVGDPLEDGVVRATMVLKAICLARGHSGVRPEIVQMLVDMINADILPVVPAQGSVGASGDLAPLSHLAGGMTGIGQVRVNGETLPATEGLARAGLQPVTLGPKEGVALINGTQTSTALALCGLFRAEAVFNAALAAGALTMEATAGRQTALDSRIQEIRGQRGQIEVASSLRHLVADSPVLDEEFEGRRLQDPYCLRCMPQVMGSAWDLLCYAANVLEREANAVSDNPLMFPDDGIVLSGGNFHGQPIAFAADVIAMALCEIGSMSERRTAMLMDSSMSGLAPFLTTAPGLNSGYLMAQVTSAALVAENRARCTPNSVDSIPTSAGQEDHVSMATHGSLRLTPMSRNTAYVVAIELMAAAQGLDLRNGGTPAPANCETQALVRQHSARLDDDRVMAGEIESLTSVVLTHALADVGGMALGEAR